MRRNLAASAACLALAASGAALAAEPHEHGSARLAIAVDAGRLTVELHSPLESLVGFEHAPRSERERTALAQVEHALLDAERLFRPSPEARCRAETAELDHPYRRSAEQARRPDRAARGGEEHAELEARWIFVCAQPQALVGLEVLLFDAFRGIARIRVQTATPRGQSAATLTRARRSVAL
jgi:hypothetical protein